MCPLLPLVGCLLAVGTWQAAAAPPRPGELAGYAKDGTLAARVAFAKEIGNDQFDPDLLAQARFKMQRLLLEAQLIDPGTAAPIANAPPPAWQGMSTTGTVKVLCLLIEFNDFVHNPANTPAAIQNALFGAGDPAFAPYESLTNYYQRSSYNKLTIQGNTVGWYRTAYDRSTVAQNTEGRQDLIKEALNHYAALGHDFSQYDSDGDGEVDMFYVIYAGPDNGWGNFWWAYQPTWQNEWPFAYQVSGKTLSKYSFQFESQNLLGHFSPRVIIHETGHALGIPDFYDYDDTVGPDGGVGGLDMMDGNWGDHNCFSKWILGWLTPTVVGAFGSQTRTLRASGTSEDCIMIVPAASAAGQFSEYFMVQNRIKAGNDDVPNWPGSGMLIWHIDATAGQSYAYNNSNTSHKLLRLMEADGLEQIENNGTGNAGDFYAAGSAFTPTSLPNSSLYNGDDSWVSVTNFTPAQPVMSALFTINNPFVAQPTAGITSPVGGFLAPPDATISITANASDPTSGIPPSVAFYGDGSLISTDPSPPYTASWVGAGSGSHVLTAVATGSSGSTHTSAPVVIGIISSDPPPNDDFTGSSTIAVNPGTATGTNFNASAQTSEPDHAGRVPQRSVWWTWRVPITGTATITTAGSSFDTILAAYTGSSIDSLVARASNDDASEGATTSAVVFAVDAGDSIQIAVDGHNGAVGTITLNVVVVDTPPANDDFAAATTIPNGSSPVTVTGVNTHATAQPGEPAHAGRSAQASLWWRWTAPSDGWLRVSTAGSSFDTVLGVYTGTAVDALTVRASNDDSRNSEETSSLYLAVSGGTTYFIAVDSGFWETGDIALFTSFDDTNDPPTITLNSPTDGQSAGLNFNLNLSAEAYDPEGRIKEVRFDFYLDGSLVETIPAHSDRVAYEASRRMLVAGEYTIIATVEDDQGLTASVTVTVVVGEISLPTALDNPLTWLSGGAQSWSGTAGKSHDGTSAAVSGALGDGEQSWLSTTVTGPGNIACWWSVSSQANFDFLKFYIDGVPQQARISGEVGWTPASWMIPAGNHTVKWQYEKDGSQAAGADAAWVDQVVWLTPPELAGASVVTAPTGVPLSYSLISNVSVASYLVLSGTLPDGLELDPATGEVAGTPTTAGTYNVTLQGSNAGGSGTKAVTFTIFAALPIPISVETPPLPWTTGGDSVWYGESTVTFDGVDAAQSGPIMDSKSVWAQTYVAGPGTLAFWWKVSSEPDYDLLRFAVDGVEPAGVPGISGAVDWQPITVTIPAGNHALRWTYAKDYSLGSGEDAGWLDQVVFTPDLPWALDTPALAWGTSGDADWAGQILTTHDGVDAARSGVIAHSQQSTTEIRIAGAGLLSFWWKVSSEANYDFLRFYLDGEEQPLIPAISGEVDWQQHTLAIPAHNHSLRWTYSKDGSNNIGADTGWLDQVDFTSFNFTAPGTTAGRSLWRRPEQGAPPVALSARGTAVPYDMMRFTVGTTGTYTLKSTAGWDNYLFLYSTAFDPASPLSNVLLGNDDFESAGTAGFATTLTAGTPYFLVASGFNNSDSGKHILDISGAGGVEVTLAVPGSTVGRPVWHRPDNNAANPPTTLSGVGTAVPFDAVSFTVSATGGYRMQSTGSWDNYLLLYANGFDPATPLANVVIGNDDLGAVGVAGFAVTLEAGKPYVLVTNGYRNSFTGKYTLAITGPGRPQADPALVNWRLTWFGSKTDGGNGANGNDYDHDGISNLLEFAFGLDPTRPDAALLPQGQRSGANYQVTFAQPDGVTGTTYGAQWSDTLLPGSWTALPDTGVAPQHTFSIPLGASPKAFLRLKVSVP